jgi:hypothetical protein
MAFKESQKERYPPPFNRNTREIRIFEKQTVGQPVVRKSLPDRYIAIHDGDDIQERSINPQDEHHG